MTTPARPPSAVLFACNLNRVRSPMAAAILRRLHPGRLYVDSCGFASDSSDPDDGDPFVREVMGEAGYELGRQVRKSFDDLGDDSFDLVICLTPEAHQRALRMATGRSIQVEHWPIEDPTAARGSRERVVEAYRAVRDRLKDRIRARFPDDEAARAAT